MYKRQEQKAKEIAESMRNSIRQIDTKESGFTFDVSASFGISSTASSKYQFEALYANADEALYGSKKHGRNRVSVYHINGKSDAASVGQAFQPA